MRAVIQRVSQARVTIGREIAGEIGPGLLVLLGVQHGDTDEDARWLADKIASLRIFEDPAGKMNLSITELGTEARIERPESKIPRPVPPVPLPGTPRVLVVSQFTLIASTRKGARPSFNDAAKPDTAIPLYESFIRQVAAATGRPVATGRFGAMMAVSLVNDGPVTLVIDSKLRE